MTEQQAIEAIANDIQDGIYGWTQKCGTEWQKWTYSLMQAKKIYDGDLIISLSIENEQRQRVGFYGQGFTTNRR